MLAAAPDDPLAFMQHTLPPDSGITLTYYYIYVLILYMCPHTTRPLCSIRCLQTQVLHLHTTIYVSSYYPLAFLQHAHAQKESFLWPPLLSIYVSSYYPLRVRVLQKGKRVV
jgi:hypothetical protein